MKGCREPKTSELCSDCVRQRLCFVVGKVKEFHQEQNGAEVEEGRAGRAGRMEELKITCVLHLQAPC